MHVKAKQAALAGLLAAFTVVLVLIASIIESSSLFFIAAASFCVGIVIREWDVRYGGAFWTASTLVNFIVLPNKMYCLTYAAMGLYLLLSEWLWEEIAVREQIKNRTRSLWVGKYAIFNSIYLPLLFLFQSVLFAKPVSEGILIALGVAGQPALFVFDKAYCYFQAEIWGRLRTKLI